MWQCKADILRLEFLWHHGGVYVDADMISVGMKSLNPIVELGKETAMRGIPPCAVDRNTRKHSHAKRTHTHTHIHEPRTKHALSPFERGGTVPKACQKHGKQRVLPHKRQPLVQMGLCHNPCNCGLVWLGPLRGRCKAIRSRFHLGRQSVLAHCTCCEQ